MTTTDVVIRVADEADVPAMARVWLASALRAYASIFPPEAPKPTIASLTAAWSDALASGTGFVAEHGGRAVGCVHASAVGELGRLYVDPDAWGHGIGARLHDVALDRLVHDGHARARLWVLEANPVRAMYERRGWVLDPARRTIYPGVDDVSYVRALP